MLFALGKRIKIYTCNYGFVQVAVILPTGFGTISMWSALTSVQFYGKYFELQIFFEVFIP